MTDQTRLITTAILTNLPTPYRRPLWKSMKTLDNIEPEIWYSVGGDVGREWQIDDDAGAVREVFFKDFGLRLSPPGKSVRFIRVAPGVLWRLLKSPPDVLVVGDASWTSFFSTMVCMVRRTPYVIWCESVRPSRSRFKRWFEKLGFRGASAFLVPGNRSKEYLLSRGVDEEDIVIAPQSTDSDYWSHMSSQLMPKRSSLREKLGYGEAEKVIVYVGGLWDRKRPRDLVRAVSLLQQRGISVTISMIGGSAVERKAHNEYARNEGVESQTRFFGFMHPDELAEHFTVANCLALVSDHEPWGYVVNEAMYFGLPVVVSDAVSAGDDLVNSSTGLVTKVGDTVAIAEAFETLLFDPKSTIDSTLIKKQLDEYSPLVQAQGFEIAIRQAASKS